MAKPAPVRRIPRTPAAVAASIAALQARRAMAAAAMSGPAIAERKRRQGRPVRPARVIVEPSPPQPISAKERDARAVIANARELLSQRRIAEVYHPSGPFRTVAEIAAEEERKRERRLALQAQVPARLDRAALDRERRRRLAEQQEWDARLRKAGVFVPEPDIEHDAAAVKRRAMAQDAALAEQIRTQHDERERYRRAAVTRAAGQREAELARADQIAEFDERIVQLTAEQARATSARDALR